MYMVDEDPVRIMVKKEEEERMRKDSAKISDGCRKMFKYER